jgi:hypothetical protein
MEPDEPVEVYSSVDANDAEILRIALHGEGIKCEITGELQGGFTGIGMTPVRLFVRAEDFDRARSYLEHHQPRG